MDEGGLTHVEFLSVSLSLGMLGPAKYNVINLCVMNLYINLLEGVTIGNPVEVLISLKGIGLNIMS